MLPAVPSDVEIIRRLASETGPKPIAGRWARPPAPLETTVLSVMRNEQPRIEDFLHHYRALGVRHFAIVDNASTDGTRQYLATEPDVCLFAADGPFDWRAKHGWITSLIERLGRNHWYLLCDADEHCVFEGSDTLPLSSLVAHLERLKRSRARGALVDLYRDGPIAAWSRPRQHRLNEYYRYFDAGTYREHRNALLTSRTGGPRQRLMGHLNPDFRPELTKYPLFRLGAEDVVYNPHVIWPPTQDEADPCLIGILHYKFDGELFERLREAVTSRRYWNASAEYEIYLQCLRADPAAGFFSGASRLYRSPGDLLKFGVIESAQYSLTAPRTEMTHAFAEAIRTSARISRATALGRRHGEICGSFERGAAGALQP